MLVKGTPALCVISSIIWIFRCLIVEDYWLCSPKKTKCPDPVNCLCMHTSGPWKTVYRVTTHMKKRSYNEIILFICDTRFYSVFQHMTFCSESSIINMTNYIKQLCGCYLMTTQLLCMSKDPNKNDQTKYINPLSYHGSRYGHTLPADIQETEWMSWLIKYLNY